MGNHIQFIPGRTLVTLIKSCDGLFPPQLGVLGLQLFPTHICLMWEKKIKIKKTKLYFMVQYKNTAQGRACLLSGPPKHHGSGWLTPK